MQKNISLEENDYDIDNDSSKASTELFTKKKRMRQNSKKEKFSLKEEEKILKYALKLSQKEFKESKKNLSKKTPNISIIEECQVINATEEDLKNPISFFESLFKEDSSKSSGIIKIKAPIEWQNKQKLRANEIYLPKFKNSNKKLNTRKQDLSELYLAKVKIFFQFVLY